VLARGSAPAQEARFECRRLCVPHASGDPAAHAGDRGGRRNRRPVIAAEGLTRRDRVALETYDARAAMALIRDAVEAARANSRTTCRVTGMCDRVHTPLPKASLRCCASTLGGSASMPQPKPFTTDAAPTRGRRAKHPAPDSTRKNFGSDGTHPFIPPPTREQLMAGSAKLRRVYKVEA
jgi:hypothetical protein